MPPFSTPDGKGGAITTLIQILSKSLGFTYKIKHEKAIEIVKDKDGKEHGMMHSVLKTTH